MQEFNTHKPGTFCWVDLGTTDIDAANKLYSELFGWQAVNAMEGDNNYWLYLLDGKAVAGVYKLMEEQLQQGVPPNWLNYIAVSNASEAVAKAKANGGHVVMEPIEVGKEGKMGVVIDSEGAALGLWEAGDHIGTSFKRRHGALCWNEFGSHNPQIPAPFYESVFDWKMQNTPMGDMDYNTYFLGEEMVGGMYQMPDFMKDVPAHWLSYFEIDDLDKGLSIVESHGGSILMPKSSVPGVGQFAVVRDPQGAVLGLIQSEK